MNRSKYLSHPKTGKVDLPLIVPSFSSKGFAIIDGISEVKEPLKLFGNKLQSFQKSYLISSFDLFHKHFGNLDINYDDSQLIFLDSGGYELIPDFDSSEPKLLPIFKKEFSYNNYLEILDELYEKYEEKPFIVANYDWEQRGQPFNIQIEKAILIFQKYANWLSNFILKPQGKHEKYIDLNALIPFLKDLSRFNVIGVTEKELGENLIDKLRFIALLRSELNKKGIDAPIHIWGGLDPMITPLYYLAGADIFDGVSWLRYTFFNGIAVNRESYSVLNKNIGMSYNDSIILAMNDNLKALEILFTQLRSVDDSGNTDFKIFKDKEDYFKEAYQIMRERIPEIKGF